MITTTKKRTFYMQNGKRATLKAGREE